MPLTSQNVGLAQGNGPGLTSTLDPNMGSWLNLIGGVGALGGGLAQAGAQNNSASLAQQYAQQASQLGGFGLSGSGPGQIGATGNPLGAGGTLNYGNFGGAYSGLGNLATGNVGTAGGIGAPNGLNPALQGAFNTASGGLSGINAGAIGNASNANLTAATGLAGQAGQGFAANAQQQYNSLQQLQATGNQQQAQMLQNTLFGSGQLGASGNYAAQNFGQGLAMQNAADAAQAQNLGISALGTTANAATGLTWMGSNALNSAFSNFGNASMLPGNVQGSYLSPALNSITGAGNLTNTGLGMYNAGLQSSLGQNQASARAGYLGTTNANSPNQQSPYGQLLGNLFGGLATGNGTGGALGNTLFGNNSPLSSLFGGGGQTASSYAGGTPGNYLQNLFSNPTASGMTGPFGTPLSSGNIASAYQNAGLGSGAPLSSPGLIDPSTFSGADTSGLADQAGSALGFSPASGEAASGASSALTSIGGAGAAAEGANAAGLFGAGAAAPGASTAAAGGSYADYLSNLAQTGFASNSGVAGSIAASDTTGSAVGGSAAADAGAGAGLGAAAMAGGLFVGGAMLLADYFGSQGPSNAGWNNSVNGGPGWNAQKGGIQNDNLATRSNQQQ